MAQTAQTIAADMKKRFPIKVPDLQDTKVSGNSFWVGVHDCQLSLNTKAPLDQVCRLDSHVHVRSEDFADGFAGSAYYEFSDQAGNIVFALIGDGIGVNGKGVPGKDDIDQPQTKFVPMEVATEIYSVKIFGVRTDDTSIDAYVAKVHQFAAGLEKAKGDLVSIGVTVAEIVAAIEAA